MRKKRINFKSFLIILIIILLLIAAINLNRNLIIVQRNLNDSSQRIHNLEQKLSEVDSRYAKVFAHQDKRIDEISNTPAQEITYVTETKIEEKEQFKPVDLQPAVWLATLLTTLKLVGKSLIPVY